MTDSDWLLEATADVMAELGPGNSEAVYQAALEVELRLRNIAFESQRIVPIVYKGYAVGHFRLDLVAWRHRDEPFVLELKALNGPLRCEERRQLEQYLKTTGIRQGYLVNFQQKYKTVEVLRCDQGLWTEFRPVHGALEV
jgi:GxxExxY protein